METFSPTLGKMSITGKLCWTTTHLNCPALTEFMRIGMGCPKCKSNTKCHIQFIQKYKNIARKQNAHISYFLAVTHFQAFSFLNDFFNILWFWQTKNLVGFIWYKVMAFAHEHHLFLLSLPPIYICMISYFCVLWK